MIENIKKVMYEEYEDRKNNTLMLKQIPNLKKSISLSLGNCIFIPTINSDETSEYEKIEIKIDEKVQIICKPKANDNLFRQSLSVYPASSFDFEGISILFEHSGIPIEFKEVVFLSYLHTQDESILSLICENPKEILLNYK